jgi:hypothetical protein
MKVLNNSSNPIDVLGVKLSPGATETFNFQNTVIPLTILQENGRVFQRHIPTDVDIIITSNKIVSDFFEVPIKDKIERFEIPKCNIMNIFYLIAFIMFIILLVIILIYTILS